MKKNIIITNDGSTSILLEEINESYHSIHGAIVEAEHVFIKSGLLTQDNSDIKILEVGFGTGLNALLTYQKAIQKNINIDYHTIELYPVKKELYDKLNFTELIGIHKKHFIQLHNAKWEERTRINNTFQLTKNNISLEEYTSKEKFNIIYFDAFSPSKQPELWSKEIFKKMYNLMDNNGFLVTYCAQGEFRRTLNKIGFEVLSLDGPPGKRQMTRAHRK